MESGDIICLTILGIFTFCIMLICACAFFHYHRVRIINSYNFLTRKNYLIKIENEVDLDIREKYFYKLNALYNENRVLLHCYMDVKSVWSLKDGNFSFQDEQNYTYRSNMRNFAYAFYADYNYTQRKFKELLKSNEDDQIHKELLAKQKKRKRSKIKRIFVKI